ncbi:MAG: prepilin-type N-terminal cleavage/methylation domain-containing protein [Thermoanaerobaculia bacterium]|nr:prepilin-type N-terminal cleavage/methylation domain-containing protein [Thermoanaerobaculia bacterium]
MLKTQTGFNLLEMVVVLAITGLLSISAAPRILDWSSALRVRLAAAEVASTFQRARIEAARRRQNLGIRFEVQDSGEVSWTLYRDGDGDGIRSRDIEHGIDPQVAPARRLRHLGRHVRFGLPESMKPTDPADPRQSLRGLDDPIRFGSSNLASFGPLGTASPGTAYLTDGHQNLVAVRVLGASARVKVIVYDPERERWR